MNMINIVIISDDSKVEELLTNQNDMDVTVVTGEDVENIIEQIGQDNNPDIIIIEKKQENLADKMCYLLSKNYPNARSLILLGGQPNFEMLQTSGFKARGYVTEQQRHILDKAVRVIYDGEAWLPRKLVAEMLNRFASSFFSSGEMES